MTNEEESALTALLEEPTVLTLELEKKEPVKKQLYAHVHAEKGKIVSVSAMKPTAQGIVAVEIEHDLGIKFLSGKENITRWVALKRDESWEIMRKIDAERQRFHRVKDLPIYELMADLHDPDVRVEVGDPDVVLIHYRGDKIEGWKHPVRLYFTAEGDPTHLKGVISLDVNTLNEIQAVNHLPEWPNPVELPLHRADDVSVYVIKSHLRVAISRHHEAASN